ncbi:MAG: ankyrin repeat domain-containing protein [Proteobacteria bacterium]|nr:ankyrin repeat domain-containing protein [Pseudomonadota bacterium]
MIRWMSSALERDYFNALPEEMKNALTSNSQLSTFASLSMTDKDAYSYIKLLSQSWLMNYFPYAKKHQPNDFANNPLRLLAQKFHYLKQVYQHIPRPLIQKALLGQIGEFTNTAHQPELYQLALTNGHSLTDGTIENTTEENKKIIVDAAAIGNLTVVQNLIQEEGPNDDWMYPALNSAAKHGQLEILKFILAQPQKNTQYAQNTLNELIVTATKHRQVEIIKYLISVRACSPIFCHKALKTAISLTDIEIVKALLQAPLQKSHLAQCIKLAIANENKPIEALLLKKLNLNPYFDQGFPKLATAIKITLSLLIGAACYLSLTPMTPFLAKYGFSVFGFLFSQFYFNKVSLAFFGKNNIKLIAHQNHQTQPKQPRPFANVAKFALSLVLSLLVSGIVFSTSSFSLSTLLLATTFTLLNTLFFSQWIPINTKYNEIHNFDTCDSFSIYQSEETFSILNMMGHFYPYKTPIKELKQNIKYQLENKTNPKTLTNLFANSIVNSYPISFYHEAQKELKGGFNEDSAEVQDALDILKQEWKPEP